MTAAKLPQRLARQVCQLCALDDAEFVSWAVEAPGLWRYTCTNHSPPHTWLTTGTAAVDETADSGVASELGVYDDLLALFPQPGPFQEWGIVEYRYAGLRPSVYQELVKRYSHTVFGPTQYSVSAFLGLAAGRLAREGQLALRFVNATGYWSYNGIISSFCLAPAEPNAGLVTWDLFAHDHGFHPDDWPALDFRHDDAPRARLERDEPWTEALGPRWFRPDQLSFRGLCAWNHNETDAIQATHLVVTELRGVQDARACCDECFASVQRYLGRSK